MTQNEFLLEGFISADYISFHYLIQMKMLGINSRLDQVFDAPLAVKEVLISQFALQNSVCLLCIVCFL